MYTYISEYFILHDHPHLEPIYILSLLYGMAMN